MAVTAAPPPARNLLLRALEPADRALITPYLEPAAFARGDAVLGAGHRENGSPVAVDPAAAYTHSQGRAA